MANKLNIETESSTLYKDIREIFADARSGTIKREDADSFTNTLGKGIKALSLILLDRQQHLDHQSLEFKMNAIEHKK